MLSLIAHKHAQLENVRRERYVRKRVPSRWRLHRSHIGRMTGTGYMPHQMAGHPHGKKGSPVSRQSVICKSDGTGCPADVSTCHAAAGGSLKWKPTLISSRCVQVCPIASHILLESTAFLFVLFQEITSTEIPSFPTWLGFSLAIVSRHALMLPRCVALVLNAQSSLNPDCAP